MGVLKSVEPTGFLAFAPAFAERTGRMWIGGSSKIARTAEEEFCLRPPVWFRLCRLRKWADAHQPEMKNDLRASGSRLVSASPDQDSPMLTSLEQPHRPWLVPGAGTL